MRYVQVAMHSWEEDSDESPPKRTKLQTSGSALRWESDSDAGGDNADDATDSDADFAPSAPTHGASFVDRMVSLYIGRMISAKELCLVMLDAP